jgi:hypothetical protein
VQLQQQKKLLLEERAIIIKVGVLRASHKNFLSLTGKFE